MNTIHDRSDNLSVRDSSNVEDFTELQSKINSNTKAIKEYESHLRSLIQIAYESDVGYARRIQSGLEKLKF